MRSAAGIVSRRMVCLDDFDEAAASRSAESGFVKRASASPVQTVTGELGSRSQTRGRDAFVRAGRHKPSTQHTLFAGEQARKDWPWPPDAHFGPKCMLINGLSGSGGDAFPFYFKQAGLGKLIGTRTWGGLVGLTGYPALIDGADVDVPSFAFYENDGTWGIEGHGVDPDVEVVDDPSKMQGGADPQLDRAIEEMLDALAKHPHSEARRPPYPDRSGMGLDPKDK